MQQWLCFVYTPESLHGVMMDALSSNKVEFVQLILRQGVVMKEFLTVDILERLYQLTVSWHQV